MTNEQGVLRAKDAALYARIAALEAERDRLREALVKYGQHRSDGNGGCGQLHNHAVWPCTCGFSAALEGTGR